jgi:hypothetical protein
MEEKLLIYTSLDCRAAIIEWLARWMTVSALGPRTFALSSNQGTGYLYFDEAKQNVVLQFEAPEQESEVGSLAHLFWFLSLCDDLIQRGIASAIVIGAKDDIDSVNVTEQARHAAAWYPNTLLGDEDSGYLKVGPFQISPYALDHLTTFMTPPAGATTTDRSSVVVINAFLERQREESARRAVRAAAIAGEAMHRLQEPPGSETNKSDS